MSVCPVTMTTNYELWAANLTIEQTLQKWCEQMNINSDKQCIYSLHGVRFLACLLVLIAHVNVWGTPLQQSKYYETLIHLPGIGMSAFFILSGFLIHYLYHNISFSSFRSVKNYYVSRIARIYPLYILMVYLCFEYLGATYTAQNYNDLLLIVYAGVQSWFYQTIDGNMLTIATFSSGWSISTELFFYFTYPVFAKWIASFDFNKAIKALLALIVAGYLAVFLSHKIISMFPRLLAPNHGNSFLQWWIYLSPYIRMFEFLTGCFLAQIFLQFPQGLSVAVKKYFSIAAILSVLSIVVLFNLYLSVGSNLAHTFAMTFGYTPFMAIIILYCAQYIRVAKGKIIARSLVLLGECSFALYMIQELVLRNYRYCDDASSLKWFKYSLVFGAYMFGLIALSLFVYKFFESPLKYLIRLLFDANKSSVKYSTY